MRSVITLVMLRVFIGIVVGAWSARRHAAFDKPAGLPFDEGHEWRYTRGEGS